MSKTTITFKDWIILLHNAYKDAASLTDNLPRNNLNNRIQPKIFGGSAYVTIDDHPEWFYEFTHFKMLRNSVWLVAIIPGMQSMNYYRSNFLFSEEHVPEILVQIKKKDDVTEKVLQVKNLPPLYGKGKIYEKGGHNYRKALQRFEKFQ